jgi:ABC-2 type transport system permease protein
MTLTSEPSQEEQRLLAPEPVTPSAFGDDLRRFFNLTVTLAATEFKLRYFGSILGYLWSLMRPLLFFGVLLVVYTKVFKAGTSQPDYPLYLLTGIILWTFFMEATVGSVPSLVAREGLLRKMRFPRLVVPFSVVLTAMFNLGTNLIAVLAFAFILGDWPRISWLEMPLIVLLWAILAAGIGMLLSVLYVRARDIQPIWDVITQILFYGSPIIYPIAKYPLSAQKWGVLNPIAMLASQMNHAFVTHAVPSAATIATSPFRLLAPLAIIFGLFGLGLFVFHREAPRIAENL